MTSHINIIHQNIQSVNSKFLEVNNKNNSTIVKKNGSSIIRQKDVLNIVHQNIRGLNSKLEELNLFLENHNITLLCITEHWLQDYQLMFNFNNHNVISCFARKSAIHGGSLIIVNNHVKSKERRDIVQLSSERNVEVSCVELQHFIVICIYRPPSGDFNIFEQVVEDVLNIISKSNKEIVVCGDFNVNLLEPSVLSSRLLNLFKCFNLGNLFLEATRITASSATCLDNIFSSIEPVERVLINCFDSDHCGQKVSFSNGINKTGKEIVYRPITDSRLEKFKISVERKLALVPFQEDPDDLYASLFRTIKLEFEKIFPQKKKTVGVRKFSDWATIGIHRSRLRLYDLYHEKTFNHSPAFIDYVRKYSNIFKRVCTMAKSMFIANKIKQSDNKIKSVWSVINSETGKVKLHDSHFSLQKGDKIIELEREVAAEFEGFFSSIPIVTTSSLHSSPKISESLLKSNVSECSISLSGFCHVSADTIVKTFKSLNMKKTEDLWGMSVKILDSIIVPIAHYLAVIFNRCVDAGIFPDLMKYSKVIPLFKSGCKSDPTNFRPISVLPAISKIFEKIVLNQLLSHFDSNRLLHVRQFGFTKGRSTTDAGAALIKHIFDAWEDCHDAVGIFCDLSKAFDCVEHETLLRKLNHYGVKDNALGFLSSYLSDRTQKVAINNTISSGSKVRMGVPQGSILGPFLFLVYINDLPYLARGLLDVVLFADDTSLIFKIDRKKDNFDDVNSALSEVHNWFTINNLVLNAKKTKCLRFSLPNVNSICPKIKLNGEDLAVVNETIFLGITLDSKLQWGPHILSLSGRLSSAAYAVKTVRRLTDVDTARLVYFSYFHSIMSYGILLWGSASELDSIFVLQKRAVRSIYNLSSRSSLRERFSEFNILTVASQFIYENIIYVHRNKHIYKKNSDIVSRHTRSSDKLAVPYHRLSKTQKSFVGVGLRMYNKLPIDLTCLPTPILKKIVKQTLIKRAYYKINDYINDKNVWLS